MKQVIFYSKRFAAFALACFVVVFSIGFSSSAATVATDLHADINMNVEIKYTDGTFSQSDPELIGKTPFNVDPEDWAMAAPPVFSNKQISHVRVNTDLTGYQVPSTVIPPDPVSVIKAGTYRFNDVLTAPSELLAQAVDLEYELDVTSVGGGVYQCISDAIAADTSGAVLFRIASYSPFDDTMEVGQEMPFYSDGVWFVDSVQTITIPNDTEVSAEFLTWFTANTVQQKQISGKWKFNDVLRGKMPYADLEWPDAQVPVYVHFQGEYSGMLIECIGLMLEPLDNDVVRMDYYLADAFAAMFGTDNATVYVNRAWSEVFGEGVKTIDFGTEPQFVSADFYEWLLANATPLDQVIPDDPEPETPAPVVGKTVQMRVFYRVELGLAKDAVSSISVNSGTRSGTVWTPLPYTTISSKYATDTSTGSSYIDATIQFTLPADSEVLRVYGTFYTSPFTASNIGEVVGGVQVCEFLYLDPVTDQDPSDKAEVDRVDGVVSDKLDQTGQITDTIEQLQKPSVDVNGSGAPVIGGMVVDPMQQVDPENFGSYTSVIGAIFGSGTILGYFIIAFSMIFISYVIFGKSG